MERLKEEADANSNVYDVKGPGGGTVRPAAVLPLPFVVDDRRSCRLSGHECQVAVPQLPRPTPRQNRRGHEAAHSFQKHGPRRLDCRAYVRLEKGMRRTRR